MISPYFTHPSILSHLAFIFNFFQFFDQSVIAFCETFRLFFLDLGDRPIFETLYKNC